MKIGDTVRVDPFWNETTGNPDRRFPERVVIEAIQTCWNCESGMMCSVRDNGGQLVDLDLHWFLEGK